jgi:hypothetical protein
MSFLSLRSRSTPLRDRAGIEAGLAASRPVLRAQAGEQAYGERVGLDG